MSSETALADELRVRGVVDTHYHVGPELIPRRYDVAGLAQAAREWDATVVLKNHTYPTTPLAALARSRFGAQLLGGVVLNRFVGGLNGYAVQGAASGNHADPLVTDDGSLPMVVWMPTVHAAAHLRHFGFAFDPRWSGTDGGEEPQPDPAPSVDPVEVFDGQGRPRPELVDVLESVAAAGARLATGHLGAEEILRLVPLALECGVAAVLVTHPHYPSVGLDDADLKRLASDERVFVEHCFAIHTIEGIPLEHIARSILATGPEQVLLSTDFGQVRSERFPAGTVRYATALAGALSPEIGMQQLVSMFTDNGRRALGLDPR